jgi:FAD/FMN-containing dehydrogenase
MSLPDYTDGTKEYADTISIDNSRAVVLPLAVVYPRDEAEVALAIHAARACAVPFSVISGGHSAQGYGLAAGGLTLNIRGMNTSTIHHNNNTDNASPSTVTVGAGARYRNLYAAMNAPGGGGGLVPIGGGCPDVGVAGFVLGGGWSFLSRSYGLAIDTLQSVRMVLANGSAMTLSADSGDPELWWAVRGGGGGNFGVATSFTLKLFEPEPRSSVGQLCWPEQSEAIQPLMRHWLDGFAAMPPWLNLDPCWLPLGPNRTRLFCFTTVCNAPPHLCTPQIDRLRQAAPATSPPVYDTVKVQPYLSWQMAHDQITAAQHGRLYLKSFALLPGDFTLETMAVLAAALAAAPSPRNLILCHVGGGAIALVPSNGTAFPHRKAAVILQVKAIWEEPHQEAENVEWVDGIARAIAHNVSGAYVNYIDGRLEGWEAAYYGANLARLKAVKRRVDPDNFFAFNQSIRG